MRVESETTMNHPPTPVEYHRGLVSDKRRVGRGILAILLLLGGMQFFIFTLAIAATLVDGVIGTESRAGYTPLVNAAGAFAVALLIPWSMLIQRWLYGVRGGSLSSVLGRFRFDLFGRALVVLLPVTVVVQIVYYWTPLPQTTWSWHDTLFLVATALVLTPLQAAGEEYGFRGLIMRVVGSWTRNARLGLVLAIVISSVLFALVHVSTSGFLNIWFVVFGAGTAWITWRTGGLEIAIVLHAVFNTTQFVIDAALQVDPTVATDRSAGAVDVTALIPIPLIIGAVVVVAIRTRRSGTTID
ncbi:CPBP family intramembrane metalloprotease [Herbiconiux sp. CPCC 203407]|uniref:CPBP family intramembrane metalloprotease n=1 Tax=Herbiconiux oxytropis TaxID=2970915 RepID=A0AA42BVK2_9MICO|nr:type II CAAX endopeptidase family protein [Herbiconiux oxytropis]MCS5721476.1 CPBP family intramembrane metalloprotease [Herbiconiux oxytropis]MCS5724553.1 CPBP family intramembrane metalloprotease [Herbiconiux oxytropis]